MLKLNYKIMEELVKKIEEIATRAPEINMCNYDDDQVRDLNNAMIEIWLLIHDYKGK